MAKYLLPIFFQNEIENIIKNAPSFSIKTLIDSLPGKKFDTDEFLDESIQSKYFSTSEFISTNFNDKIFSIFHLNISSIQKHIDDLRSMFVLLEHKFDIICITETMLLSETSLVNVEIEGYDFIHTHSNSRCGGVGMYIKSNYEYEILPQLTKK